MGEKGEEADKGKVSEACFLPAGAYGLRILALTEGEAKCSREHLAEG